MHGYNKVDGKVVPDQGKLTLRGYSIEDLVNNAQAENRYGYEEVAYLLITGSLPTKEELDGFCGRLGAFRHLSDEYVREFPMTTVSSSIMNVLQRAVLLLYAFDAEPDAITPEHEIDVAISMLARLPRIAAFAHMASVAKRHGSEMHVPHPTPGLSTAETILQVLRGGMAFTRDEAMLLDVMLMLHGRARRRQQLHVCLPRAVLLGHRPVFRLRRGYRLAQGPAPRRRQRQGRVHARGHPCACLQLGGRGRGRGLPGQDPRQAGLRRHGSHLRYGHAVYTLSDPRAEVCRRYARTLAAKKDLGDEFALIERIERLAPQVMRDHGMTKPICANIDLYTGFIYKMLGVPETLFTPLFAVARMAGWSAHRMEELFCAHRIIRPAYRPVIEPLEYKPLADR